MHAKLLLFAAAGVSGLWAGQACAQTASPNAVAEVVVTASPILGDPDRFATIVEQVNRDDVLVNGGASLADSLRDTPGVSGTGFATGASRPVMSKVSTSMMAWATSEGMGGEHVGALSAAVVIELGPAHAALLSAERRSMASAISGASTRTPSMNVERRPDWNRMPAV